MKHTTKIEKLTNGVEILFVQVPGSSTYYLNSICRAGYNSAQKDKYELPHLLEHLAFSSTQKYASPQALAQAVEEVGAYFNAQTSSRSIQYYIVGGIQHYKKLTQIALEQYVHTIFKQKYIDEEKNVVKREFMRDIENESSKSTSLNYAKMFTDKVVWPEDRIKTLHNITKKDIEEFYKATHTQKNSTFVIAGDITGAKREWLVEVISKATSHLPSGTRINTHPTLSNGVYTNIATLPANQNKQAYFAFSFLHNEYDNSLKAFATSFVFSCLYNEGSGSRLFLKARQMGLAYSINSGAYSDKEYSEVYITDKTDPDLMLELFTLCLKELHEIAKGNYSEKELKRAKGYEAGSFDTGYETSRKLANWYIAYLLDDEPLYTPSQMQAAVNSVTRVDISNFCKKFMRKDKWVLSLIGNDVEVQKLEFKKVIEKYFG